MSTWEQFDKKYLSQLLMRRSAYRIRDQIWDVYYRLNIRDAISFVDQGGHVLSSSGLTLPSMPSRNSVAETSVTNLLRESGSGACLDLQVIDTVRSGRDREDTAMHHLLCGGLYKPRRRVGLLQGCLVAESRSNWTGPGSLQLWLITLRPHTVRTIRQSPLMSSSVNDFETLSHPTYGAFVFWFTFSYRKF